MISVVSSVIPESFAKLNNIHDMQILPLTLKEMFPILHAFRWSNIKLPISANSPHCVSRSDIFLPLRYHSIILSFNFDKWKTFLKEFDKFFIIYTLLAHVVDHVCSLIHGNILSAELSHFVDVWLDSSIYI